MNETLERLKTALSSSLDELDIKLKFINVKLNKFNHHLIYIYLLLFLNIVLTLISIFK